MNEKDATCAICEEPVSLQNAIAIEDKYICPDCLRRLQFRYEQKKLIQETIKNTEDKLLEEYFEQMNQDDDDEICDFS